VERVGVFRDVEIFGYTLHIGKERPGRRRDAAAILIRLGDVGANRDGGSC
jgi:hypothetical protein